MFKIKNKINPIDQAYKSRKRKGRMINLMVFSIVSFIAVLLVCKIA